MKFNYRESFLQHNKGYICLGATLKLGHGKREELEENEFYIADLVGSEVFVETSKIGILKQVLQYGSADIFVLDSNGKEIMMPFVNGLVNSFDSEKKVIILNKDKYSEVVWSGDEN